jgi:hypothetical protein
VCSISKPFVPEFTVKVTDNSYDIPPTYSIDPYTGANVITEDGYHAQNITIEITIENQAFTPYADANGNTFQLYYNVRWKGHYEEGWHNFTDGYYRTASNSRFTTFTKETLENPNAPTTVVIFGLSDNNGINSGATQILNGVTNNGGEVDFQVQALIGYYTTHESPPDPVFGRTYEYKIFTGESSGWSDTQTVTVSKPLFGVETTIILAIAIVLIVIVGLLIYIAKRKQKAGAHE